MSEITFEVDGQQITAEEGSSILEACEEAGIEIPTLCHYSNLTDVGACRICTVEIDGDNYETACTTPVQDGISIRTENDQLREHRRTLLELICAEENHYCMYCDSDGDCELQDLLKEYGVDHVRIPFSYTKYPVDSVSDHLVIDHNRCILCGRCIRTCEEVVANDTLDFGERGQETKVVADLNQPIGESTCISCGSCLQVCPTGTILSKHSLYKGNTKESESTNSVCSECSIACKTKVFTRSNNLVQISGRDLEEPPGGQLCEKGRFRPLMENRDRIEQPTVSENGTSKHLEFQEAAKLASDKIQQGSVLAGMASGRLPSETIKAFRKFIKEHNGYFDLPGGEKLRETERSYNNLEMKEEREVLSPERIEDVIDADSILVYDTSTFDTHPVLSSYVRKAAKNEARLTTVDPGEDNFSRYSDLFLNLESPEDKLSELLVNASKMGIQDAEKLQGERNLIEEMGLKVPQIAETLQSLNKENSFIIIGPEVEGSEFLKEIFKLAIISESKVINLTRINNQFVRKMETEEIPEKPDTAFIFASDDNDLDRMKTMAEQAEYTIVQAARESELTDAADLVLPALAWQERSGTIRDLNGEEKEIAQVLQPKIDLDSDLEFLNKL